MINNILFLICIILFLLAVNNFFRNQKNILSELFTIKEKSKSKSFITFIIPSIGRETLKRTVNSLINQTDPDWNAIIVFDGVKSNITVEDSRVKMIEITKKVGKGINSAGLVRNIGMKRAKSKWIGFVDDDDTLSNKYVEYLKEDCKKHPNVNTIIFRMLNHDNRILPLPHQNFFYLYDVGISFAVKRSFVKKFNLYFKPSHIEDYNYLKKISNYNKPILISSNLTYFVRNNKNHVDINKKFNEIFIDVNKINKFSKMYEVKKD